MGKNASWSVRSCKLGYGVPSLRGYNLKTHFSLFLDVHQIVCIHSGLTFNSRRLY
ncbi:predicted protein [Arabidopsis lyrata subsp. lyrata]|uniref:Predicted protein n=1 Tax=Arabidopsis lyrata subsp. lyrata TaxID=81972 RepID=D7ME77_ARALL|nr:predicted protein [Arabidopsis lyrata subsp. lyrata]EFH44048.1 predicted protein [Arabidopsis lyrata subsp. lyrata]